MATATTAPEFFTNVISTFLMESDMGLGTIIGSMTFNTLGVAAVASLATIQVLCEFSYIFCALNLNIYLIFFFLLHFPASKIGRLANNKRLCIIYNKPILSDNIRLGRTDNIVRIDIYGYFVFYLFHNTISK